MADADSVARAILAGAAAALRRRAARQIQIATNWTTAGERGALIKGGEAVLATGLAATFTDLAEEFERGGEP